MQADDNRLSGKVAIVTGAFSGIGLATARLLVKYSVRVALVSRSKERLEELSSEIPGSFAVPADMTKIPQIGNMVAQCRKQYGRIDILINNAGQGYDAPVGKIDIDTLRYIFDLHVVGTIVAMQQVIQILRAGGGGSILNISSGTALMDLPGMIPYVASKKALAGISLAARQELQSDGIVVSVAYPDITLPNSRRIPYGRLPYARRRSSRPAPLLQIRQNSWHRRLWRVSSAARRRSFSTNG
jgi:short-subunit dehydrogenase